MSRRMERIAEQLKGEIARVLSQDVKDPRLRLVTVTRVDAAPDLSHALVFWSTMDTVEDSIEATQDGLESAAAFMRGRLARELSLKRTPELRFRYDPSLAMGSETLSLLKRIADGETN